MGTVLDILKSPKTINKEWFGIEKKTKVQYWDRWRNHGW